MDRSTGVKKISKALYQIFNDKTEKEEDFILMHEDNYIKRQMKKVVSKKDLEEIETFDRKVWIEAWQEFDNMLKSNKKSN